MHRMFTERPRWLEGWLQRHQNRVSFGLHVIGIPLTIFALILAAVQLYELQWTLWWRPAALFVLGYGLQWLGHRVEGNDMGEVILIKKILGRPYVAIAPKYRPSGSDQPGRRAAVKGD